MIKLSKSEKVRGFTLVETLIYITIFIMLVGGIATFASNLQSSRLRTQVILEVNNQGNSIVRTISQTIRNAQSINAPIMGNNAESLSVSTANPETNPTVFSQSGEALYITEGVGGLIPLTNNKVGFSNLSFSNLSYPSTPGVIQFRFTLQNTASTTRAEEQYSLDFYGTASIR